MTKQSKRKAIEFLGKLLDVHMATHGVDGRSLRARRLLCILERFIESPIPLEKPKGARNHSLAKLTRDREKAKEKRGREVVKLVADIGGARTAKKLGISQQRVSKLKSDWMSKHM